MTTDHNIYRAANVLIVELGDAAPMHAEICQKQLIAEGDLSGVTFWKRIIDAINILIRYESGGSISIH